MWLVYQSIAPASKKNPLFEYALWAILAIYVPGTGLENLSDESSGGGRVMARFH
jgi:hypothetical protein